MNGPSDHHTEQSKSNRDVAYAIPYIWNLYRNDINELIYKIETDLKNELMVARGKNGGKE